MPYFSRNGIKGNQVKRLSSTRYCGLRWLGMSLEAKSLWYETMGRRDIPGVSQETCRQNILITVVSGNRDIGKMLF